MTTVADRVIKTVAETTYVSPEKVTADATLESLDIDSLDRVELMMALEEEFEIEIPDEDAEKVATVQQAIDYVAGRVAA